MRFDRVIKLSLPSLEQRKELIRLLCQDIPIPDSIQEYIAHRAEGCTPAQLQEVIFGLAIEHLDGSAGADSACLVAGKDDIDTLVSRVNGHRQHIGFNLPHDGDGHKMAGVEDLE